MGSPRRYPYAPDAETWIDSTGDCATWSEDARQLIPHLYDHAWSPGTSSAPSVADEQPLLVDVPKAMRAMSLPDGRFYRALSEIRRAGFVKRRYLTIFGERRMRSALTLPEPSTSHEHSPVITDGLAGVAGTPCPSRGF